MPIAQFRANQLKIADVHTEQRTDRHTHTQTLRHFRFYTYKILLKKLPKRTH